MERKRVNHIFGLLRDPLLMNREDLDIRFAALEQAKLDKPDNAQMFLYAQCQILATFELWRIMQNARDWP